jgi:hypothetical protein
VTVELLRPLSGVEFVDEVSDEVPLFRFERVNDESSKRIGNKGHFRTKTDFYIFHRNILKLITYDLKMEQEIVQS